MIRIIQKFLFLIVLVPALGLSYYVGLVMTDRHATDAGIMIKRQESGPSISGLGAALGLSSVSGTEDERILLAYILSFDMLNQLNAELNLREHFTQPGIDFYSRLDSEASREEFLKYFRKHVSVRQDTTTGLLNIQVQAFDPEYSLKMMERILFHSEAFVNDISQSLAEQQVAFMRSEVERAETTLREQKDSLLRFQNQNQLLSPQGQSEALMGVINSLQADLIREEAQLSQLQSYLNPDAPQIVSSRSRIQALQREIDRQSARLVGEGTQQLNELNAQFANLQLSLEFATNNYTTALNAFEMARTEASRKLRNLVVVTSPQLSEEAQYPKRAYWVITWLIGALLVYGILQLVFSIIREHLD